MQSLEFLKVSKEGRSVSQADAEGGGGGEGEEEGGGGEGGIEAET